MQRSFYRWAIVSAAAFAIGKTVAADTFETWAVTGGAAQIELGGARLTLTLAQSSLEGLSANRVFRAFTTGDALLTLTGAGTATQKLSPGGASGEYRLIATPETELRLQTPAATYALGAWNAFLDAQAGQFIIDDAQLAQADGQIVGALSLVLQAVLTDVQVDGIIEPIVFNGDWPEICPNPTTGPDVIVGDLPNVSTFTSSGGIYAYSVGTTSCNIGNQTLNWIAGTNQHPVIGQNLYRMSTVNGASRFEQIGMSWLKHGFAALAGNLCCPCTNPGTGSLLGLGCSDPYGSGLNGDQGGLGPRSQVNAATGCFPYPFSSPPPSACGGGNNYLVPPGASGTIARRLQVMSADLNPTLNPGAIYFIEGHYVAPDDSAAGNDNNNASYRRVNIGAAPTFTMSIAGGFTTQQQKAGIQAWKDNDAGANIVNLDVPGDGRFTLGYKVTDLGGGQFHYEYALYNMNSDRSAQSFSIPVPASANISNIGFHDVFYHSGELYSGTDWTVTMNAGTITWSTESYATNANANALRWATLYNFRFDADVAPMPSAALIGLFKPGTPTTVTAAADGPTGGVVVVGIASANPPSAAENPYAPGQPFRDVLDTGTGSSITAGIGLTNTANQGTVSYSKIYVTFNITPVPPPATDNITVTCTGGTCPTVTSVVANGNSFILGLSGAIPPLQCTTFTFAGTDPSQKLQYQWLPGDVNLDGTPNTTDLLTLILRINDGSANLAGNLARYNIDRSTGAGNQVTTADLLRLVQLLNGVNTTQAFNGATVAACP